MANSIALAKKYSPLLDEVYKNVALSSALDSTSILTREGANANEIIIPKLALQGLATYGRNTGYVSGDTTLTWETLAFNYERGRMFGIDRMDNEQSLDVAFGMLAGEFMRVRVIPEVDAFRFATYATLAGTKPAGATLATGAEVIAALRVADTTMDENEVPLEGRVLYITPTLKGLVEDLATTASREVLAKYSRIIAVPQTRFYSIIDLYDGTTAGQEDGSYIKNVAGGKDINFLAVHPSAVLQFTRNSLPKIVNPDDNQVADQWKFGYRIYGLADAFDNKTKGIYVHKKA